MTFEEAHHLFIKKHLKARKGESLRRLKEGHDHAERLFLERVWWPAFGNFNDLHPEYETYDYKDGDRYIDFAFVRPFIKVAIEIDGYGTHWKNINRVQFSDHRRRQNDLVIDGWKVLRFSFDDIKDSPRFCQQKLQQFVGRWFGMDNQVNDITIMEKEAIRLAMRHSHPITPGDVCRHFALENKTARRWLQQLVAKKWMKPASGHARIRSYELDLKDKNFTL
jgi:hypothetical protein